MKFAWKVLKDSSLWAHFFRGKYVGERHLSLVENTKGTQFRRMVMKQIPNVLEHSRWKACEGYVSFWFDSWVGDGPLANSLEVTKLPGLKVCDCKMDNEWDVQLLKHLVGVDKMEEIIEALGNPLKGHDLLIWTPTIDGKFTSRNAWDCLCVKTPETPWSA